MFVKGGNFDLDDVEIQCIVVYMVNQFGVKFKEFEVKVLVVVEGVVLVVDVFVK